MSTALIQFDISLSGKCVADFRIWPWKQCLCKSLHETILTRLIVVTLIRFYFSSVSFFRLTRHFIFKLFISQAMSGFLMMLTQNGKLLYISDNAAEYLGHSMVSANLLYLYVNDRAAHIYCNVM